MKRHPVSLLLSPLLVAVALQVAQASENLVLSLQNDVDFVRVPDSDALSLTDNFTLEAWVNPLNPDSLIAQTIIAKRRTDGGTGYALRVEDSKAFLGMNDGAGLNYVLVAAPEITRSTWAHIAATYDGTVARIYVNGILKATQEIFIRLQNSSFPLTIGTEDLRTESPRTFQGQIDEVRVWNRALSEQDIQQRLNLTLNGHEAGLVGYWNFNDGTAKDLSLKLNDGTFEGAASTTAAQLLLLKTALAVEIILPAAPPATKMQLESTSDFVSGNWVNVGGVFLSDGKENSVLVSIRSEERRFYRVVIVP
jgi:hypothetical protein